MVRATGESRGKPRKASNNSRWPKTWARYFSNIRWARNLLENVPAHFSRELRGDRKPHNWTYFSKHILSGWVCDKRASGLSDRIIIQLFFCLEALKWRPWNSLWRYQEASSRLASILQWPNHSYQSSTRQSLRQWLLHPSVYHGPVF